MLGSVLAAALWLAPPADAPASPPDASPEPASPLEREYDGPRSIDAPTGAAVVQTSDPSDEALEPLGTQGTAPPSSDVYTPPPRRPVPRVLSTIEGFPESEVAVIGKRRVKFYPGLELRNQIGWISPFTIDRTGTEYEEGAFSNGRIRWNPRVEIRKKLEIAGTIDFMNGRWAPTGSDDPVIDEILRRGQPPARSDLPVVDPESLYVSDTGPMIVDPRELYLQYRFSFGLLRIGQQSFTWGQGMLANSGNYNDRFGDMRFGSDSRGDIYERILFATRPFAYRAGNLKHLVVAIGGDLVYRDERAVLADGDIAGQALIVLRYQPEDRPGTWLGGYAVYRNQKTTDDGDVYPDDDDLEVGVVDVSGQGTLWLRDDLQLIGAFEAAFIGGRTTVARDENGPHKVAQGGAVGRGYVGDHDRWLVGFDAGYASGDPDPNDRWINNFTFDDGHNVGLVLFDAVQGWRTAQSEILATNGELTGVPLNGTQFIPTRGGVSNAIYVHPKARYSLWEKLEIWGGPLIAAAPVPVVDPYTTRLSGGVPTNSVGGDGGDRYYGTELDLGIRGRFDIKNLWLQAGVQGGLLLPGAGLANRAGNTDGPIGAVWLRTEIRY